MFSTAADNQPSVEIHVLQGERPMAPDNKSLGKFTLDGILPAPRGVPQIEVTFDIDANGIVNVSAADKGTGREQKITIQASSGLSEEEIQKMQQDAELHADEDLRRREMIELRNLADSAAYQAEKTLADNADKIDEALKADVEEKVKAVREALEAEGDDDATRERIQTALDALTQALQQIGEAIYGQQGPGPGPDGPGPDAAAGNGFDAGAGAAGAEEGTVEGEFREV